jgi:hypothetical protein
MAGERHGRGMLCVNRPLQFYSFITSALDGGGWWASRPGRFTLGKEPVPTVKEAVWAPVSFWISAENLAPTGIRSSHFPARSESLYRLRYPGRQCHTQREAKFKEKTQKLCTKNAYILTTHSLRLSVIKPNMLERGSVCLLATKFESYLRSCVLSNMFPQKQNYLLYLRKNIHQHYCTSWCVITLNKTVFVLSHKLNTWMLLTYIRVPSNCTFNNISVTTHKYVGG